MTSTKSSKLKILLVDDDPNILDALKRQLRSDFDCISATSGAVGLELLSGKEHFAVVVSDMRMPGMDGAEFLNQVKKVSSETVRLMLTGNADQESAMRAVNEGNIFRFLTKPCPTADLKKALEDGIAQYRLITAEKDLLQNTLSGSVKLLTDVLSFSDPAAFGGAMKLRQLAQRVLTPLQPNNAWEIELAAMLCNLATVTIPAAVTAKARRNLPLSTAEKELLDKAPAIAQSLIVNIPRLEGVAKIVLFQNKHFDGSGFPYDGAGGEEIPLGARVLKILKDLLEVEAEGASTPKALEVLKRRAGTYDAKLFAAIEKILLKQMPAPETTPETKIYEVKCHQLFIGQTLLSNVETKDGVLLVSAGSMITESMLARLVNYSKLVGIKEPIRVDCFISSAD